MKNNRLTLLFGLTVAITLCSLLISSVYAYDYSLVSSADSVPKGTSVTMTFTTNNPAIATVFFEWIGPDGTTVLFSETKDISAGTATSTYTPQVTGSWEVDATANNGQGKVKGFAVEDLLVTPEYPLIGSLGALGIMVAAFGLKSRFKKL